MIFQGQESSGGGLHYSKVRSETIPNKYNHRGYPTFVYQTADGTWARVNSANTLEETECLDGSVLVTGVYVGMSLNVGDVCGVTQTMEGDTLVLSAKIVTIEGGAVATVT